MIIEKYNPNSLSVSAILGLIASGDIAIPRRAILRSPRYSVRSSGRKNRCGIF